ncbi:ENTH/VHS [Arabidopsis suecica]|uniref:ENTH/VHS n=1 Tax=Arabidopsis suecica TaxID=45249 RepID=A0A8T2EK71_ARASU|nr:ENTH/VHS [Arabidopsis suecica]
MGRITSFADLIGRIKDKASQSKAALVSSNTKIKTLSFHLSVLRATTHDPSTPPGNRHLAVILSAGTGSRATASSAVESIMERLHTTGDACVALKSLIIIHHIVKHGRFILQDQLSVFPASGGRNYLKLSAFRDEKSPLMWELSSWVRWYALYLEHLLSTSRIMGFFISSTSSTIHKEEYEEMVSSLTNSDLLREIDALVGLLEEACKIPDLPFSGGKSLADKITQLVGEDYVSSINELYTRFNEFKERSNTLSFGDTIELVCALKRLESCKERLSEICHGNWKRGWIDGFWGLVLEVKGIIGNLEDNYGQIEKSIVGFGKRDKGYESARFTDRLIIGYSNPVRFSSGRFSNVDRFNFPVSGRVLC